MIQNQLQEETMWFKLMNVFRVVLLCLLGSLSSVELFRIYCGETKSRIWLSRSDIHPVKIWLDQISP